MKMHGRWFGDYSLNIYSWDSLPTPWFSVSMNMDLNAVLGLCRKDMCDQSKDDAFVRLSVPFPAPISVKWCVNNFEPFESIVLPFTPSWKLASYQKHSLFQVNHFRGHIYGNAENAGISKHPWYAAIYHVPQNCTRTSGNLLYLQSFRLLF